MLLSTGSSWMRKRRDVVNSASNKKIFVYDLQGNFKRSFQHAEGAQYLDVFDYDADNLICYDMSASYKDGQKRDKEFYHALHIEAGRKCHPDNSASF